MKKNFAAAKSGDLDKEDTDLTSAAGKDDPMEEHCAICSCALNRKGEYGKPTVNGRSHATEHHYVPERFFGRSKNRRHEERERIFEKCPWGLERKTAVYCYECHEELLHNPVFLPDDITKFAKLVTRRQLYERSKPNDRVTLAGRIKLLHEVIEAGINSLLLKDGEIR